MANITLVHDVDIERRSAAAPDTLGGDFMETYIVEESAGTNFNANTVFAGFSNVGGKGDQLERRALQYFDLNKFIPADATITAATWEMYVLMTSATGPPGNSHDFRIVRLRRTDWVEDEASWDNYKSGSAWGTAGATNTTTDVDEAITDAIGNITTAGWKSFNIINSVSDAWDNRSGICTFLLERDDAFEHETGIVQYRAKEAYSISEGSAAGVHHIRITYTLAAKTFEAFVFDGDVAAAVAAYIPRVIQY